MSPIVRTNRADKDLIDIWASIAAENPSAADNVLDAIEARWQQLAQHPYSGLARDDIAAGIRHLVAGQYLTLYRVTDQCVEIVRVLHGHRKIDRNAPIHVVQRPRGRSKKQPFLSGADWTQAVSKLPTPRLQRAARLLEPGPEARRAKLTNDDCTYR